MYQTQALSKVSRDMGMGETGEGRECVGVTTWVERLWVGRNCSGEVGPPPTSMEPAQPDSALDTWRQDLALAQGCVVSVYSAKSSR